MSRLNQDHQDTAERIDAPSGFDPIAPAPATYGGAPYMRDELLHDLFEETCRTYTSRSALHMLCVDRETSDNSTLSYGDLRRRSLLFAEQLRSMGIGRHDRVVICLPRGIDQYVVILGVLWVGGCYVPVDWHYPQDRIDFIVEDCGARLVVTEGARAASMQVPTLEVDLALGKLAAEAGELNYGKETGSQPDDLAYIIYTSGTTGRPKGVMISHRNACHFVRSESAILGLRADDKVFGGFSLAFDMSIETMWSAFFVGAELMVATEALAFAATNIAPALAEAGVTVWHVVPSLLTIVETEVPSLRLLNLGGEACPPNLVEKWARPGLRILNTYGPTETTVTATWKELEPGRRVTIGLPLPGYTAWIVDENMWPLPRGAEGELIIGGPSVGQGYLGQTELTAQKFTYTPFAGPDGQPHRVYRSGDLVRLDTAGEIEFLGRIDTQAKIRGFRVELTEIEAVIAEDPAIAQVVVELFKADDDNDELLVSFIVPRGGGSVDLGAVRERVRKQLPNYMRPGAYQLIAKLPTLVGSGKVDRKALPRPVVEADAAREQVEPETPTEIKLHDIWSAEFAPQKVSVLDDLFEDLGGHSLKAARLVSAIRRAPGLESVSIQDLYNAPTIRRLAECIDRSEPVNQHELHPIVHIAAWKRWLCWTCQTLALIPIYAVSGLQWFFPYLTYTWLAGFMTKVDALIFSALSFLLIPPLAIIVSILVKWLLIGRFQPGKYPLWGSYYLRWWLVRRFSEAVAVPHLAGTPLQRIYYRAMGAKIGKNVYLGRGEFIAADLITIGDNAIISDDVDLGTSEVERGVLLLGGVEICENAFVGARSVVGRDCRLEVGAALEDLSTLPAGGVIPAGERWAGSPARITQVGHSLAQRPQHSPLQCVAVRMVLAILAILMPLFAILPIAPGLVILIELNWRSEGYLYLLYSPLLALTYVLLMCLISVLVKRIVLGNVKPGTYHTDSWFYVRYWFFQQVHEITLRFLHTIYATLYVAPWYRALGAKVGPRAEISTAAAIVPDLVDIGSESFIADDVMFGGARIGLGTIELLKTRIGYRSFIGNSALLPTGANVGDNVLIGVLSTPPATQAAQRPGSTWFGSPPISIPVRHVVGAFDESARFRPGLGLVVSRLSIEAIRILLGPSLFIALFNGLLSIVEDITKLDNGGWLIVALFPLLYVCFTLACGLSVVALKWLVIGRYRQTTQPLWSTFVWRTELVTATYEYLAVYNLLLPLRGTPWLPAYLRLLGCKIGKRCYFDTTDITEFDLVTVGDDVCINDFGGIQTHLFEDRVMKVGTVKIGDRTVIGTRSIVLYDAELSDDTRLGDLSVVMKGETLPAGTSWHGSPARPV